ncbi:M60 family metallopeptidase [Kitasatospora sp. NPDC059747]|uniref:M60 family metallopeptidase n=1 Tax=Kitasatospora sp. NPDC059747 TaxID=3346930 RepID=UPI00364607A0
MLAGVGRWGGRGACAALGALLAVVGAAPLAPARAQTGTDVTVTASGPAKAAVGESITYGVKVTGSGMRTEDTTLTFRLPDEVDFVSVDGRSCAATADRRGVVCAYGVRQGGTFGQPDITVRIKDSVAVGTRITARFTTSYRLGGTRYDGGEASVVTEAVPGGLTCPVVQDAGLFPQPRTQAFPALPTSAAERDRLQIRQALADVQPTGFCLRANRPVQVTVTGGSPDATVELQVGTWALVDPYSRTGYGTYTASQSPPRSYRLQPGENRIGDPSGGILYVRHTADSPANAPSVTVTLDDGTAVQPIPHFDRQSTTNAQWQRMLGATTATGPVELVGDHVVIAGMQESALRYAGESQDELLDTYEQILRAEDDLAGLDGSTARDTRSPLRFLAVESPSGTNPNATYYRIAMPGNRDGVLYSATEAANSWGLFHEFGHQHQQRWTWGAGQDTNNMGEVTVNLYSMAADRQFGHTTNGWADETTWAPGRDYLAQSARDFATAPNKAQFDMFAQLDKAFGPDFYPALHRRMRAERPDLADTDRQMRWFTVTASRIAGADLSDHFADRWGLPLSRETLAALAALGLPKPTTDPSTVAAFTGKKDTRTEIVRFTNRTGTALNRSSLDLRDGTWARTPAERIPNGRTAVLRVTTSGGIDGTAGYTLPGAGQGGFTYRSPEFSANNYAVSTGQGIKVTVNDQDQNTRTTPPGTSLDSYTSTVLGKGDDPTVWVTYERA